MSKNRRRPPLTHKTMLDLLAVASLARADADAMGDTPSEREHAKAIYRGCNYISRLAAAWADAHGCQWPTDYKEATK